MSALFGAVTIDERAARDVEAQMQYAKRLGAEITEDALEHKAYKESAREVEERLDRDARVSGEPETSSDAPEAEQAAIPIQQHSS